ncbi:MAG: glycyl-radical enzyme activating protein [Spirochaetes bacterium]|jgi:pyruvate formate lyase activating enzyme|nr:glycyl-radical enzyme activating protein [Spirochaetota bacterium]
MKQTGKGTVLEIQRMSTEDGPGIRTTVFLKGCGLKCAWCHNPESISPEVDVQWFAARCISCGLCADICECGAISRTPDGVVIDRKICRRCGACAENCPSTAMEMIGVEWSADDLACEIMKDRAYFQKSGGGVTLSGGEVAMQAGFAEEVLRILKKNGIHTAIDTSGLCVKSSLARLLPLADLVLFDIKEIRPDLHKKFTGADNGRILENAVYVAESIKKGVLPREMWIRTPLIPGATDRHDNISGIGGFIAEKLGGQVTRWELCAFNNLCRDKYGRLGLDWQFSDTRLLSKEEMEHFADTARKSGVDPGIVSWSGPVRFKDDDLLGGKAVEENLIADKTKDIC